MSATKVKQQYELYSSPTGIEDTSVSKSTCFIYPTKLEDHFNVVLPTDASGQVTVNLHTTTGLTIMQGLYHVSQGGRLIIGGFDNLDPGHYIVTVKVDNNVYQQKLIK